MSVSRKAQAETAGEVKSRLRRRLRLACNIYRASARDVRRGNAAVAAATAVVVVMRRKELLLHLTSTLQKELVCCERVAVVLVGRGICRMVGAVFHTLAAIGIVVL